MKNFDPDKFNKLRSQFDWMRKFDLIQKAQPPKPIIDIEKLNIYKLSEDQNHDGRFDVKPINSALPVIDGIIEVNETLLKSGARQEELSIKQHGTNIKFTILMIVIGSISAFATVYGLSQSSKIESLEGKYSKQHQLLKQYKALEKENQDRLNTLKTDYETLKLENEKLSAKYSELEAKFGPSTAKK